MENESAATREAGREFFEYLRAKIKYRPDGRAEIIGTRFDQGMWLPMNSAPHDGTAVLVQPGDTSDWPFIGRWINPYSYWRKDKQAWVGKESGLCEDGDCFGWMPLP